MSLLWFMKPDGINRVAVSAANPLPVSATAGAEAFEPTGNAVRTLSTTSARVALGSVGPTALVTNTGTVVAYIKFGDVTVVATATDTPVQAGQSVAFDVGSATYIAGITASGAGALTITTGTGLPAIAGGGSSGSAGTQYAEDATHASGDLGTVALVVRKDTAAQVAGTDGDYSALVNDASGRLHVNVGASELPTGAATEATLVAIKTAAEDTATINVAQDTAVMKNGATSLTPQFKVISASTSGDNPIVPAVTGKKIRVLAYNLMGAGAVNARFQTAAAGAYLTGLKYIAAAGGGICAPFNPVGWFETIAGDLLNLELSGAVAVGGEIVYVEV